MHTPSHVQHRKGNRGFMVKWSKKITNDRTPYKLREAPSFEETESSWDRQHHHPSNNNSPTATTSNNQQQPSPATTPVEQQSRATPITTIEPVQHESTQPEQLQSTKNQDSNQTLINQTGPELPTTSIPPIITRSGRVVKTPVRFKDYHLEWACRTFPMQ